MFRYASEALPKSREEFISEAYSERKTKYICDTLTEDELMIIDGTDGLSRQDYLALAKTKRILQDHELAVHIDKNYFVSKEFSHDYLSRQTGWMKHEKDIIKWELNANREGGELTEKELREKFIEDFKEHENGLRFKIYYFLRHPKRVERIV